MEPDQLRDRLDDIQVIDVREDGAWSEGHIEGSVHIPMDEVESRLSEVSAETSVVTVCRSGQRSSEIAEHLQGLGRDAENLQGGLQAWMDAGHHLADSDGARRRVA